MKNFPHIHFRALKKHLPVKTCGLQCFALIVFASLLSSCATTKGPSPLAADLPAGLYRFECGKIYPLGAANVTHTPKGVHVQLLEKSKGHFELRPDGERKLTIAKGDFSYPGLKRSFGGHGVITGVGLAEGDGTCWIKSMPTFNKDHRVAPWTLRKLDQAGVEKYNRKQRQLAERKERASRKD